MDEFDNLSVMHIPGFPGYLVTSCGRVVSVMRGKPKFLKGRLIQRGQGYEQVRLRANERYHDFLIHRLVFLVFNNLPLDAHIKVIHLDGGTSNHSLSNLDAEAYSLTEEDVIFIFQSRDSPSSLAKQFGVSVQMISKIKKGDKYQHVTKYL